MASFPVRDIFLMLFDVFVGFGSMEDPPHPFRWKTRSILGRWTALHKLPFHGMMAKCG